VLGRQRRELGREARQRGAHDAVIVATERVARDVAGSAVREHGLRRPGVRRPVVHAQRQHAQRSGLQLGRTTAQGAVTLHVVHFAVMTEIQPAQQARLVLGELDAGDAHVVETMTPREAQQLRT
jgi:hypothetical protein